MKTYVHIRGAIEGDGCEAHFVYQGIEKEKRYAEMDAKARILRAIDEVYRPSKYENEDVFKKVEMWNNNYHVDNALREKMFNQMVGKFQHSRGWELCFFKHKIDDKCVHIYISTQKITLWDIDGV